MDPYCSRFPPQLSSALPLDLLQQQPSLHSPRSPSSTQLAATTPFLASVATTLAPRTSVGFLQIFLSFVAGGIFFSSVLAAAAAVLALGRQNLKQVFSVTKFVVGRVWAVFVLGLKETKSALRSKGKWNWRQAWTVLKAQLTETRKAAVQGVEAIRMEADLYSAAVGAPGLIPLQYVLDRLMPFSLATQLEEGLRDTLADIRNSNVRKLSLQEFSAGTKAPKLLGARVYDLGSDAMVFDVDVVWNSEIYAKILLLPRKLGFQVPVTVRNVSFEGTVRVELTPLTSTPPGFGAALVSLPSLPTIGLDIDVAGGKVTKVPWLRKELMSGLQKSIEDELLWPKRLVVPSTIAPASGKIVLSKTELTALALSDPFLRSEKKLAEQPMLKEHVESRKPDAKSLSKLLKVFVGEG